MLELKRSTRSSLETQIEQLREKYVAIKASTNEIEQTRDERQRQIKEIETSTELVKVGELKHKIDGLTQLVTHNVPTGAYEWRETGQSYTEKEPTLVPDGYERKVHVTETIWRGRLGGPRRLQRYNALVAQKRAQGFEISEQDIVRRIGRTQTTIRQCVATQYVEDQSRPKNKIEYRDVSKPYKERVACTVPETKSEPIPNGNLVEFLLAFPETAPVELVFNPGNKGWNIKLGTDNKQSGYRAVITYEQGQGCVVDADVIVQRRYSEAGRRDLENLINLKNNLDKELLTLSQQEKELDSQIQRNIVLLDALSRDLSNIEGQASELETTLKRYGDFVESKRNNFESLTQLQAMLSQPVVTAILTGNSNTMFQPANTAASAVATPAPQTAASNAL